MSKLDYFVGRPIVAVHLASNEEGDWPSNWAIELGGGVMIKNHDKRRTSPPSMDQLQGTGFLMPRFEDANTVMEFGFSNAQGKTVVGEITLTATQYSIVDDQFTSGVEVWPQADMDEDDSLPPDPSFERVAEGPETPAEAIESQEE